MMRHVFCLLLAVVSLQQVLSWSGNVCSKRENTFVVTRECAYRTWQACCLYRYVRKPSWKTVRFCCTGWRHNGNRNCNIPVCSPGCKNGGTCTKPGECTCTRQFSGPSCANAQCSHVDPCYPGECAPGSTRCSCAGGFTNSGNRKSQACLKLASDKKPEIFQMQARLWYWGEMLGKYMEMYSLLADSTGRTDTAFIWTNRKLFNRLDIVGSSEFRLDSVPPAPSYVTESQFGLVSANTAILLTKDRQNIPTRRRRQASERFISQNDTEPCPPSPNLDNPATSVFTCNISQRLDRQLENGDILRIAFLTKSGGFRKLQNVNTNRFYDTQYFVGHQVSSEVEFRFDLAKPYHCSLKSDCSGNQPPLRVQDFTRGSLEIGWGGWRDDLSGMFRYALEVFPLTATLQNRLQILEPLHPIYIRPFNHSDNLRPISYTPQSPGLYALILEVADLANNTVYIRRLSLYDPTSRVSTDHNQRLYFSSASHAANFSYQSSTSKEIVVTWTKVFRNALHEDLGLLGAVETYPPQLEDNIKSIPPENDDQQGGRTVQAIPNVRGIVKFELAHQKVSKLANSKVPEYPPASVEWQDVDLNQHFTIPTLVDDGDTIIAWVRATDVMGSQLVRNTIVTFDRTEAEVNNFDFQMNHRVEGIPFSSTFTIDVKDPESGVNHILWTFTRSNGSVIYSDKVNARRAENCGSGDFSACYCTSRGECFLIDQSYSLSNCHMMVEKESLATEVISVRADITNAAGLVTSRTMKKGQLTMLNGTEAFYPPQNVHLVRATKTSATIGWDFPPSCYKRTDVWVITLGAGGQEVMKPVHKDAETYSLPDLEPGKTYTIQLKARYSGHVESDSEQFTFHTEEEGGLSGGAIAGTVIGLIVLVLVVLALVVFVCVRRRGTPQFLNLRDNKKSSKKSLTRHDDTQNVAAKYSPNDQEDLYLAAGQTWQEHPDWLVDKDTVVLENQIAEGKFADIYRAQWTRGPGKSSTVVAKILRSGFTEEDANKMMKKIQFLATEVGTHPNVLQFYGAVVDNEHLGPEMLLEYCEMGQLDKWLQKQTGAVSEDTMDKLFRFAKDIACGMDYLAHRRIVHSRLAARNVLLTFLLDVKIAGFGPQDPSQSKVPAKWASPEVLEEKPATEKSDVWAFGVTLWEIFSMGQAPYSGVRGTEMGPYLKSGKRMDKPELANHMFYTMMQDCWKENAKSRPPFSAIKKTLCELFTPEARNSQDFYYDSNLLQK